MAENNENKAVSAVRAMKEAQARVKLNELIEEVGHQTVHLVKEFTWMGNTYTEIDMNFEALTGEDIEAIGDEMAMLGINVTNPRTDKKYHRFLAARAAKVPNDMIAKLPASDYNQVTRAAMLFLSVTA